MIISRVEVNIINLNIYNYWSNSELNFWYKKILIDINKDNLIKIVTI